MKKFLLFPLFAILGCLFIGCSSDFEENEVSDFEKVENAKLKIMEMANDYGLSIVMPEDLSDDVVNNVDFKELEDLFRSLSSLDNVNKFSTERKGFECRSVNEIAITRKSMITRGYENFPDYSTNFPDSAGQTFTTVNTGNYYWECSCNATWRSDGSFDVCCVNISPNVELIPSPTAEYTGAVTDANSSWREIGGGDFTFSGDVSLAIMTLNGNAFFTTKIGFDGIASNKGGTISWYHKTY